MVQVRKLVLAIAAASALSSGMAQALELGELTLKSAQNQPLLAEIELLDVKDLTAAQVVPSLAPEQEFSKAGVPRPAYVLIGVILVLTRVNFLPLKALLNNINIEIPNILGYASVDYSIKPLYLPGTIPFMLVAIITIFLHGMNAEKVKKTWVDSF